MFTNTVVMISNRLEAIKAAQLAKTAEPMRSTSAQLGDRSAPSVFLQIICLASPIVVSQNLHKSGKKKRLDIKSKSFLSWIGGVL